MNPSLNKRDDWKWKILSKIEEASELQFEVSHIYSSLGVNLLKDGALRKTSLFFCDLSEQKQSLYMQLMRLSEVFRDHHRLKLHRYDKIKDLVTKKIKKYMKMLKLIHKFLYAADFKYRNYEELEPMPMEEVLDVLGDIVKLEKLLKRVMRNLNTQTFKLVELTFWDLIESVLVLKDKTTDKIQNRRIAVLKLVAKKEKIQHLRHSSKIKN